MKIGLISDVHANKPALDAVLDDLHTVDEVYHCGDMIGYHAFPEKTINRFEQEGIHSVSGNHDRAILGNNKYEFPDSIRQIIEWTSESISNDSQSFLKELPAELKLHIKGKTIQMVHGSPRDPNRYIYPTDITLKLIEDLDDDIDVLVYGHTHYPVITKLDGVLLLNPGSVGQPRDGDWRASYAVFDTQTGWIELRRSEYDIEKSKRKAKTESFPQDIIDSFLSSED